jgi:hypothetical protein
MAASIAAPGPVTGGDAEAITGRNRRNIPRNRRDRNDDAPAARRLRIVGAVLNAPQPLRGENHAQRSHQ